MNKCFKEGCEKRADYICKSSEALFNACSKHFAEHFQGKPTEDSAIPEIKFLLNDNEKNIVTSAMKLLNRRILHQIQRIIKENNERIQFCQKMIAIESKTSSSKIEKLTKTLRERNQTLKLIRESDYLAIKSVSPFINKLISLRNSNSFSEENIAILDSADYFRAEEELYILESCASRIELSDLYPELIRDEKFYANEDMKVVNKLKKFLRVPGECPPKAIVSANPRNSKDSFAKHSDVIYSVAFSPCGTMVASASRNGIIQLNDTETGQLLHKWKQSASISNIKFSPTEPLLVSTGSDKEITIWSLDNARKMKILQGHTDVIKDLDISSSGEFLLSGSFDSSVRTWNLHTGSCLNCYFAHKGAINAVSFSPIESIFASGGDDLIVRIWMCSYYEPIYTFKGHSKSIYCLDFSPCGSLIASGSLDSSIKVWSLDTGNIHMNLIGHDSHVCCLLFTSAFIISAGKDIYMRVWEIEKGTNPVSIIACKNDIMAIALSKCHKKVVTGGYDNILNLWDIFY